MDIKDLKIFQTIAREQNITQSSRLLYMTPQGISKVIKKLENELDCTLFTRTASGMRLTETGTHFLSYADSAITKYGQTKAELLRIEQCQRMTVDLLSAYGILRLVTPECIIAFRAEHPDITLHYREYLDLVVERLFAENEGNVAFSIGNFDAELYEKTSLDSFPIMLLVHESHPLSTRSSVTIEDLKDQPLYIESSQFQIHHLIVNKCREAGFEPDIVFETSGFSLCHKMVKQNKGISVTVNFIYDDMKEDGIKQIPFEEHELRWNANMFTRKSESANLAVRLFQEHIQSWIQKLQTGEIAR